MLSTFILPIFTLAMSSSDVNKKVAYSIVRHLQSQVSVGALGEDEADGIDGKPLFVRLLCLQHHKIGSSYKFLWLTDDTN